MGLQLKTFMQKYHQEGWLTMGCGRADYLQVGIRTVDITNRFPLLRNKWGRVKKYSSNTLEPLYALHRDAGLLNWIGRNLV